MYIYLYRVYIAIQYFHMHIVIRFKLNYMPILQCSAAVPFHYLFQLHIAIIHNYSFIYTCMYYIYSIYSPPLYP